MSRSAWVAPGEPITRRCSGVTSLLGCRSQGHTLHHGMGENSAVVRIEVAVEPLVVWSWVKVAECHPGAGGEWLSPVLAPSFQEISANQLRNRFPPPASAWPCFPVRFLLLC